MIEVKKIQWDETVARHLERATDKFYGLDDIRRDVEHGHVSLFGIFLGRHIGSMILRHDGEELCIVAAGGETAGGSLIKIIIEAAKDIGSKIGVTGLRAHTKNPAIGRLFQRGGGLLDEYVYRLDLEAAHGR